MTNLLLNTDSYKTSHYLQYPPGTEIVSSYIESRPVENVSEVVFFGLQMFIAEYLLKPFNYSDIVEADKFLTAHGVPFNRAGWEYIFDTYDGYLPMRIEALPEGMVTPPGTPLVQVRNTDPAVPWLTSYMETALLRAVWYPSTVATHSRAVKKIIAAALERTSDDPAGQLPFKLHDFGARGCTSMEQAGIGGAAHLVNFMGTDTLAGALYAQEYYGAGMAGFSIPAAEHSTITSWGREHEADAYANMLEQFPTGLVAVVSDSYDFTNAVDTIWGEELKQRVLQRDGVTVIRPDSGDPADMVMYALYSLGNSFGSQANSKGFHVLNDKVRIIQGDGIDIRSIEKILDRMQNEGWSADNIAFGMGAGLLQHVNRDTFRFAMKASAIRDGLGWREVFKDPKTDPGKASKRGIQYVYEMDRGIFLDHSVCPVEANGNLLQPVYEMYPGDELPRIHNTTFSEVRKRAAI